MSVNQKIKEALKEAGITMKAFGEELNLTESGVSMKFSRGEIDSYTIINTAAKMTGKPFSHFKPNVYLQYPGIDYPLESIVNEIEVEQYETTKLKGDAKEDAARHWQKKYHDAKEHIETLKEALLAKDQLIEQLKENNQLLKDAKSTRATHKGGK